jgi:hypothetical protein
MGTSLAEPGIVSMMAFGNAGGASETMSPALLFTDDAALNMRSASEQARAAGTSFARELPTASAAFAEIIAVIRVAS